MTTERIADVTDLAVERHRRKQADAAAADATHHELATSLLAGLRTPAGVDPVAADGQLWIPDESCLWRSLSIDALSVMAGERFGTAKRCQKVNDYRAIAQHALAMIDQPSFFDQAPIGIATPSAFWELDHDARVTPVPLRPEHRQRFCVPADPDATFPEKFFALLGQAFEGDSADEQIDLAAEAVGAALFGLALKMPLVLLLLGPGATGKSTFLKVTRSLFDPRSICSVSPARWGHEYFAAGLAGKRLNAVGELDDRALPPGSFKAVTGGDLIEGRHPNHRPFWFRCEAAHFFNSNVVPGTMDRSDAFFRRWRVVRFGNVVPESRREIDLAERIIATELGGVLQWAIGGAERVAQRRQLGTSPANDEVLRIWRVGSNPVLLFLSDEDFCALGTQEKCKSADLYSSYREWAAANGNKPMSSQKFCELLDQTAGSIGVYRARTGKERKVSGVRLASPPMFNKGS